MNASKTVFLALVVAAGAGAAEPAGLKLAAPAAPAPSPTTIGQLSDMARQKRIADETKPATPTAVPAGMTIVPSSAIIPSGGGTEVSAKPPKKKERPAPPPEVVPGILAIAKLPSGIRYVELADTSGPNRYTTGQVTPSGWIVGSIGAHFVELAKPAANKKPARTLTLSIVNP